MNPKKRLDNQSGYAMIITLLALLLITVIGASLMVMGMNTARITKSERDNQSSYYIAEAGLVEKRAQINEIAKQVYDELKQEYDVIVKPIDKQNFNLQGKFRSGVQKRIQDTLIMSETQTYSEQYAQSPESIVTVTPDSDQQLKYLITSIGKVPSDNGSLREKAVSQTVEIKMIVPNSIEKIQIPGNNTVQKLKACYAIKTSQSISLNNGSVNGDIFTDGNFLIPNGWPIINGNIISKGNTTITGGVIKNNIYTDGFFNIPSSNSNPTIQGNIVARGNASVSGGSLQKDIVSFNDTTINAWMNIGGNVIAKNNIIVNGGLNSLGGKFIYGNTINNIKNPPPRTQNIDLFLTSYLPTEKEKCIEKIPALPDEKLTFPETQATSVANQNIKLDGGVHEVISNTKLNINDYRVLKSNYSLVMDRDMYFSQINIDQNLTLKIDLQNQDRKIYVDNFNNIQGHIELINPGSLEIIVQDSFNSKGKLNAGGQGKVNDLTIRYAGLGGISLSGESDINGSFYIKRAPTLKIASISNSGIRGDLVIFGETSVSFGGGASVTENLILAPYSSITLEGGAEVKGNVIAKNFAINGSGSVTPPVTNSGEWEIPGSKPETIEIPTYNEGNNFLITDSIKQE